MSASPVASRLAQPRRADRSRDGLVGKKNGELLRLMAQHGFEVFLTADQGLQYQQNLRVAGVGVVVLMAASNRLADLSPLMPSVSASLVGIKPGQVVEVRA